MLMSKLYCCLLLQLLNLEGFLFNILFEFKYFECFLTQNRNNRIFWIGIEEYIEIITFLPSNKFHLCLAPHPFRVPKCQDSLPMIIFISNGGKMLSIAPPWEGNPYPRVKSKLSCILEPLLFSRCIQLVIQNAWFLSWLKSHSHGLFIIAYRNTGNLTVTLCSWVVRLWFFFLARIVDDSLIACDIEEAIGWKKSNWFGNGSIDAEYVL